jgi:hypothetical protein
MSREASTPGVRWARRVAYVADLAGWTVVLLPSVAMLTSELIEQTKDAYGADPDWLGSEAHRQLLTEFVSSRAPGVSSVVWLKPGKRSYRDARGVVALERPSLLPDGLDVVRLHSELALHELLHALYTDHSGGQAMDRVTALLRGWHRDTAELLFNWLEDARIRRCEHDAEPANDEYVEEHHRFSIEQLEEDYARQVGESPWTKTPNHTFAQVRIALAERILVGDRGSDLAPVVASIVGDVYPLIDKAVAADGTNGAREATLGIIEVIARRQRELN